MILLDDVSKVFRGTEQPVHALTGVSTEVARGEFVSIVGPSGSGKSTLLQIIGCLDTPTSGTYALNGTPVAALDDSSLSKLRNREIGFVFQAFNLVQRTTAVENVETPMLYGSDAVSRERAHAVMERVGILHRAHHYPQQMSGGEQQRVAIARALVMNPALLIADEPTGNLDAATGAQIMGLLDELHAQGLTIVLVTHDEAVAARAGRTIVMRDGRVTGQHKATRLTGAPAEGNRS